MFFPLDNAKDSVVAPMPHGRDVYANPETTENSDCQLKVQDRNWSKWF